MKTDEDDEDFKTVKRSKRLTNVSNIHMNAFSFELNPLWKEISLCICQARFQYVFIPFRYKKKLPLHPLLLLQVLIVLKTNL